MATGTVILPVQAAKIGGAFITLPAGIDGGAGAWKLLFDASQTESALWQFRLPANYASSPVLKVLFAMASDVTNKVDFECDIMALSPGDTDIDSASFDTINEVSGGTTVPATTAGKVGEISITLTNNDSWAAGDLVLVRLHRDHDDADDTASGDAEVLAVSLEYTTT